MGINAQTSNIKDVLVSQPGWEMPITKAGGNPTVGATKINNFFDRKSHQNSLETSKDDDRSEIMDGMSEILSWESSSDYYEEKKIESGNFLNKLKQYEHQKKAKERRKYSDYGSKKIYAKIFFDFQ